MGNATTISLDRFRRRNRASADVSSEPVVHPLVGTLLGVLDRRYGLMASEAAVCIEDVVATSGDLAVADRMAFVAAMERRTSVLVVLVDGWYVACTVDGLLEADNLAALRPPVASADGEIAPRIMSIVTERGITPALGPLACA